MHNKHGIEVAIKQSLIGLRQSALEDGAINLFKTMGYSSKNRIPGLKLKPETLCDDLGSDYQIDRSKAMLEHWQEVCFLFQLKAEDLVNANQLPLLINDRQLPDRHLFESYLFYAVKLNGSGYSRTNLASITREINRIFSIPVLVLFLYDNKLTIAIINRRPNKKDYTRDVLEKVTLIKDISLQQPHRAHIEILFDLSLSALLQKKTINNFNHLHDAWQKVLDSSELNKKFYGELANWHFWAELNVKFPKGADIDEKKCNAINVIRLITRIIFIWFIKEKGLIKEDLFDKNKLSDIIRFGKPDESVYYKAVLQNLFFATLNTEMNRDVPGSRRFAKDGNGKEESYLDTTEYRYLELFHDSAQFLSLCEEIPFLNGGLFECLDRQVTTEELEENPLLKDRIVREGKQTVLRVDGFSRRKENPINVPDFLFFAEEHLEDLNQVYGTKNKKYRVRGLIDLLSHYKFTIEENTPLEEEIALDPELLGKVFENLLAAYNPETETTARKQTGSFYTPREIVDYMVDQALLAYFSGKLDDSQNINERLEQLLGYIDKPIEFSGLEIDRLIQAIDELKVLDPACGSGAFPMGVLHKLVYLLQRLDPDNTKWREVQRKKAIRETEEAYKLGDKQERLDRVLDIEETFTNNTSDYGRKLYLIENCIYGVDIQPIAVQIAKLRFFISLIVEQQIDNQLPNRGIKPLPNLETKFVAANTLIAIDRHDGSPEKNQPTINYPENVLKKCNILVNNLYQYLRVQTPNLRAKYLSESILLGEEINHAMQSSPDWTPVQVDLIFNTAISLDVLKTALHLETDKKATDVELRSEEIKALEEKLLVVRHKSFRANRKGKLKIRKEDEVIRRQLIDLLKTQKGLSNTSANQLACWNPYDQNASAAFFDPEWMFGVRGGFDNVIGNPPYGAKFEYNLLEKIKKIYSYSIKGKFESYRIFMERGVQLANTGGAVTYVVPNTWMYLEQADLLRKFLLKNTSIKLIITFPQSAFEATVDSIAFLITKIIPINNITKVFEIPLKESLNNLHQFIQEGSSYPQVDWLTSDKSIISYGQNKDSRKIIDSLRKAHPTFGDYIYIRQGLIPYLTKEEGRTNKYISTKKVDNSWSEYLDGSRCIDRYSIKGSLSFIKYGGWLYAQRDPEIFTKPRIIFQLIRNISLERRIVATYLERTLYSDRNTGIIFVKTTKEIDLKYILGIFNSTLINFIHRKSHNSTYISFPSVEKLPLAIPEIESQIHIITLVEEILNKKQVDPKAETKSIEEEIDKLVYKIYGLSEKEIALVEGNKKILND